MSTCKTACTPDPYASRVKKLKASNNVPNKLDQTIDERFFEIMPVRQENRL